MAWAWGVSRLIDALETTPGTTRFRQTGRNRMLPQRQGRTGGRRVRRANCADHSAGIRLRRRGNWRISDAQKATDQNVQTLSQIVTENVWLTESLAQFSHTATKLPFDHHQPMGMIAPRALLVTENTSMEWLGNVSTYTAAVAAHTIWQAMGLADHMA